MKLMTLIIGPLIAYLLVRYRGAVLEFTGDWEWAQRIFGSGGTAFAIVLVAIGVFFGSIAYAFGVLELGAEGLRQ